MKMQRSILTLLAIILTTISAIVPSVVIYQRHQKQAASWLFLQKRLDHLLLLKKQQQIIQNDNAFIVANATILPAAYLQKVATLNFLEDEKAALQLALKSPILKCNKNILDRYAFLLSGNNKTSFFLSSHSNQTKTYALANAIQINSQDLKTLLAALDSPTCSNTPLMFIKYLKLSRKKTVLNKEVWELHTEVLTRDI